MEGPLQVYERGCDSDGGEGWGQGYVEPTWNVRVRGQLLLAARLFFFVYSLP